MQVLCWFASTAFASIVVIGNPAIRINQLSQNEVESIFLGKPVRLSTGETLIPYDQSDRTATYAEFYRLLMGWTPSQVSGYWSSLVFQGEASPPARVDDDSQALALVSGNSNAISYIEDKEISTHVKVLYRFGSTLRSNTPDKHYHASVIRKPHLIKKAAVQVKHSEKTASTSSNVLKEALLAQREVNAINASIQPGSLSHVHSVPEGMNLWHVISDHFSLGDYSNRPEVRHEIIGFLSNRKILDQMLNNAVPYLYYVYQQAMQRQMPAELALLPLVESGYDPFAYSHAGATGLWQMMPGTSSIYGLDINWWYDARRDTVVSTQAALNFLRELHGLFHDWLLAAAAYDTGSGAVQAAQQFNQRNDQDTSFWSLHLSQETRSYVPRLLALAAIIKNPDYYGVKLPYIPNRPYFAAINMNSQINLVEASQFAEVPINVIHHLNPAMLRWATNPNGVYTLLIPYDKSAVFTRHLKEMTGKPHVSWQYHEIRSGETLESIAKNYHTTVDLLREVNGSTADQLTPNQGLLVPLRLHRTYSGPVAAVTNVVTPNVNVNMEDEPVVSTPNVAKTDSKNNDNLKQLLSKIYPNNNNGGP